MRIACLSDIHANLVSFEAVLRDLDKQKPDRVLFLGDAATLGPCPSEVMALLRKLDPTCVLGNHDGFVLDRRSAPELAWTSRWFADQLCDEDLDYLRTFQSVVWLDVSPEIQLVAYHGSPKRNTDRLLPTTPAQEVEELLDGTGGQVFIGGHTHVQMMRQLHGKLVINAGSVGMPFQSPDFPPEVGPRLLPWAEYTLLNTDGEELGVELRRVNVDLARLKESYAGSSMPEAMDWWNLWLTPEG